MSPKSASAFRTYSERYLANVVALMLLEVSVPEMLYKLTGRGVKEVGIERAVRHWSAEEPWKPACK